MLGVSCSQNHTPVTRSGHLQGEKATAFRSYITIFSFNVHQLKKLHCGVTDLLGQDIFC